VTRYARRKDVNHNDMQSEFERLGYKVKDTSRLGDDFPDFIVAKHGQQALIEVKADTGKLSQGQWDFIKDWPALCFVVRTFEDVVKADRIIMQEATYRAKGFLAMSEILRGKA
jgi:hypothetical protein